MRRAGRHGPAPLPTPDARPPQLSPHSHSICPKRLASGGSLSHYTASHRGSSGQCNGTRYHHCPGHHSRCHRHRTRWLQYGGELHWAGSCGPAGRRHQGTGRAEPFDTTRTAKPLPRPPQVVASHATASGVPCHHLPIQSTSAAKQGATASPCTALHHVLGERCPQMQGVPESRPRSTRPMDACPVHVVCPPRGFWPLLLSHGKG